MPDLAPLPPRRPYRPRDLLADALAKPWQQLLAIATLLAVPATIITILVTFTNLRGILLAFTTVAVIMLVGLTVAVWVLSRVAGRAVQEIGKRDSDLAIAVAARGQPDTPDHKRLYELNAQFIGVTKDDFQRVSDLFADGHAESMIQETVRAVSHDVDLVEHTYRVPDFVGDASVATRVGPEKEFLVAGYRIKPVMKEKDNRGVCYAFNFSPRLRMGEQVTFSFPQKSPPGAFALTDAVMRAKKEPFESSAIQVAYPTSNLKLKFRFPREYYPITPGFDVWHGLGRVRHEQEYARMISEKSFSTTVETPAGQFCMELNVRYPLMGLHYVLKWCPADSGEDDKQQTCEQPTCQSSG